MKHYLFLHWQCAKSALIKILCQPFASLLSLAVLSLAIALPLSLYLASASIQEWAGKLNAEPQITLFMPLSANSNDISNLENLLKKNPQIKAYRFISKQQALTDFEQRNHMQNISAGLNSNPLPDAFSVTPRSIEPKNLAALEKILAALPQVEQTHFDAQWATRLFQIVEFCKKLVLFLALVLGIALLIITHNTIRMQILARKEEIEVAKLIGATDSFIRRPFLYHAFWQGLIAALISWGLSCWLMFSARPAIVVFTRLYHEQFSLRMLNWQELAILLLGSILLAIIGARMAVNQHLRQIQPQ